MRLPNFLFLLICAYLVLCAQPVFAEYVLAPSDYDVYSAILDRWFSADPRKIVVIRGRTTLRGPLTDFEKELSFVANSLAGLRPETINDFKAKNLDSYPLENYFIRENVPQALMPGKEISALFGYEDGWMKFHRGYPGSESLITFSRIGFNLYGNQALLYMDSQWGAFSGAGIYVLLNRDDAGVWSIQQQVRVWNSWLPPQGEPDFPFLGPPEKQRPVL